MRNKIKLHIPIDSDFFTDEEIAINKRTKGKVVSALDLHLSDEIQEAKLWQPFLQRVGLASIVGSSDTGKSSFLRQLAISIVLGKREFLGTKLLAKHKKVIYVSTEDDKSSTKQSNSMQLKVLAGNKKELNKLEGLSFVFDSDDILKTLKELLEKQKTDLIIIDAFADIFTQEINSSTQVRSFLMLFHKLAIHYKCLIIFLHHKTKRSESATPSKNNIVGSQGFEAKMRSILEIEIGKNNTREMTLLKCNFLPNEYKKKKYILDFDEKTLVFSNTGKESAINPHNKSIDTKVVQQVMELRKTGLSYRAIESKLANTEFAVSKTVIGVIVKENRNK